MKFFFAIVLLAFFSVTRAQEKHGWRYREQFGELLLHLEEAGALPAIEQSRFSQKKVLELLNEGAVLEDVFNQDTALSVEDIKDANAVHLKVWQIGNGMAAAISELKPGDGISSIVVDLRNCGGDDMSAAMSLAAGVLKYQLPVAVLIDDKTRGTAENAAVELRNNKALVIGRKSRGVPGSRHLVQLKSGAFLLIPKQGGSPIVPDMEVPAEVKSSQWPRVAADAVLFLRMLR